MNENPNSEKSQKTDQLILYGLIITSVSLIIIALLGGTSLHGTLIPLAVLIGLFAGGQAFRVYSSTRSIPASLVEQELIWLYGEELPTKFELSQRQLAQQRIRQRRIRRRQFFIIIVPLYIAATGFIVFLGLIFLKYNEPGGNIPFMVAGGLTIIFLILAINAFPTRQMLVAQERAYINEKPLPFPTWGWLFIIACALIPVIAFGGLIPSSLGVAGSAICYFIARSPSINIKTQLVLCMVTVLAVWGAFFLIINLIAK